MMSIVETMSSLVWYFVFRTLRAMIRSAHTKDLYVHLLYFFAAISGGKR